MRRAVTAAGWVAVTLAGACEQPRTEIVVRVESEVAWGPGRQVQSISLTVRRAGADGPLRSARTTALGADVGRQPLPLSVGVIAADDDTDTPVWVEALGCGDPNGCTAATAVVTQRAVVRFVRGQTQELPLLLASACVGATCASDQRCTQSGQCEAATAAQGTVRPFAADSGARVDVATTVDRPATLDRGEADDRSAGTDAGGEGGLDVGGIADVPAIVDREMPMDVTGDGGAPEDGPPDAGAVDAGMTDRGPLDAGRVHTCPAGMAYIPAGTFTMGDADEASYGAQPPHVVTVSAFCMDLTEVTVAAFLRCTASQCTASFTYPYCNREVAGRERYPVNCVSWYRATAYCQWRGAYLPTEAQWEYAARGTDGRTYPWGNALLDTGPCIRAGTTCPVGSYPELNSPFGLFDMGGSVWEWTNDWYASYTAAAATDPTGPTSGPTHVLRGGAPRAAMRAVFEVTDRSENVGFRCARGLP